MKAGGFEGAWGGIAGAQSTLELLLGEGHRRGLPLAQLAALVTGAPARRFGLPKARLEPGADADLALVELPSAHTLRPEALHDRNRANPFAGRTLHARVRTTLLRGVTVFHYGRVVARPHGRLLKPTRHEGAP
jgi:allantoinase